MNTQPKPDKRDAEIEALRAEVKDLKGQRREAEDEVEFLRRLVEQMEEFESLLSREFLTDVISRATSSGGKRPSSRSLDFVKLFFDTVTIFNEQPKVKGRFKSDKKNRYVKLIRALEELDEDTYLRVDEKRIRESLKKLYSANNR